MEEEEGFEPPRGVTRLSVFKTDPFSQTWVFLRKNILKVILLRKKLWLFYFVKNFGSGGGDRTPDLTGMNRTL
jgi:hypothetical protein